MAQASFAARGETSDAKSATTRPPDKQTIPHRLSRQTFRLPAENGNDPRLPPEKETTLWRRPTISASWRWVSFFSLRNCRSLFPNPTIVSPRSFSIVTHLFSPLVDFTLHSVDLRETLWYNKKKGKNAVESDRKKKEKSNIFLRIH